MIPPNRTQKTQQPQDAIAAGPLKIFQIRNNHEKENNRGGRGGGGDPNHPQQQQQHREKIDVFSVGWKSLMDMFDDDEVNQGGAMGVFIKLIVALILIPTWLVLGVLSAGWLWPPQVRKGIFVQRISNADEGGGGIVEHVH